MARIHNSYLQNIVKKENISINEEAIRRFRYKLINESKYKQIKEKCSWGNDFFYLSGCRDLLFHVNEYCYQLNEIEEIIKQLGLSFIGFQPTPRLKSIYPMYFGESVPLNDFQYWKSVERYYTGTMSMFHFYLQKRIE